MISKIMQLGTRQQPIHDSMSPTIVANMKFDEEGNRFFDMKVSDITYKLATGSPKQRLVNSLQNCIGITEIFNIVVMMIFAVSMFVHDPISTAFDLPHILTFGFPALFALAQFCIFLFASLYLRALTAFSACAAWLFLFLNIIKFDALPVRPKLMSIAMAALSLVTFIALWMLTKKREPQNE